MTLHNTAHLWGGAALVAGNVLFIANKINEMSRLFLSRSMPDVIAGEDVLLILVGQLALVIGYVAYFLVYVQRVGRWGRISLLLFCGGGTLLAIGHMSFMSDVRLPDSAHYLFILVVVGLALMLIGLISFGIINLRRPVLGYWPWLPLATGIMGSIGFFAFSGEEITATFLVFRTLFAFGLIGLGVILWLETPAEPVMAH